ncbi:TetR/AcrR family transcriptional regulator [Novosphingobium sp. PhB55]|uniref:TetR/AcrR family transcriptional regulator n=1 Tax=Novosphingobium sp. PhB55 TaxID=2485106 RepID=UPI0010653273|nr:TetR/AcrR family transcriptional regulator [Novosphingobium sp. PhB55]
MGNRYSKARITSKMQDEVRQSVAAKADQKPVRRRGRPVAADSAKITQDILTEATRMFLELGYEGTSMDAVATSLRIPRTTLYKRFSDKADLLQSVIDAKIASWSELNTKRDPALSHDLVEQLISYVEAMLLWGTKPEVRAITRLAGNLTGTAGSGFSGHNQKGYRSLHALIATSIREYGPARGFKMRDPEGAADLVMAVTGGTIAVRPEAEPFKDDEAKVVARSLVERIVGGAGSW